MRERIPDLATLRLEVEERRGTTSAGDPKHVRLIVVDSAPALFALPCGDHACRDGGHDVTDEVLRSLSARATHFEIDDTCHGSIGTAACGAVMHVTVEATYRAPGSK